MARSPCSNTVCGTPLGIPGRANADSEKFRQSVAGLSLYIEQFAAIGAPRGLLAAVV